MCVLAKIMRGNDSQESTAPSEGSTRRRVLKTIGAGGAIGLAGCVGNGGGGETETTTEDGGEDTTTTETGGGGNLEGEEIHVLTDETGDPMRNLHNSVKEEVEANTGAKVRLEFAGFGQDVQSRVLSLVQAGDPPEVYRTGAAEAAQLLNQGALANVSDPVSTIEERYGEKPPDSGRLVQDGDDFIVAPIIKPGFNLYRDSAFDKHPVTWADTLDQVEKADGADNGLDGTYTSMGPGFCTLLNQLGAVFSAGGKVCKRDSGGNVVPALHEGDSKQAWLDSLEYWGNMYEYSPDASDADCSTQQSAMVSNISAHVQYMGPRPKIIAENEGVEHADDIRLMQVPKPEGGEHLANALLDGWVTFKQANAEAGRAYIETLTKREYLMDIYRLVPIQLLPAFDSVIESDEYQSMMDDLVENGSWTEKDVEEGLAVKDAFQTLPTEMDPPNPYAGAIYTSGVIAKVFQRVILQDEDPEGVLEDAAQEIQGIIDDAS